MPSLTVLVCVSLSYSKILPLSILNSRMFRPQDLCKLLTSCSTSLVLLTENGLGMRIDIHTLTATAAAYACNAPHHCSASVSPTAGIEESLCTHWTPPGSTAAPHSLLLHHGALLLAAGTDLHEESGKDS